MKIGELEITTVPFNDPLDESCFRVRGLYKSWKDYDILISRLWYGFQKYLNKILGYFHPHVRIVFICDFDYRQVRECELFDFVQKNCTLNLPSKSTQITRDIIRNKWGTYVIYVNDGENNNNNNNNNKITAIVGSRATWSEINHISI